MDRRRSRCASSTRRVGFERRPGHCFRLLKNSLWSRLSLADHTSGKKLKRIKEEPIKTRITSTFSRECGARDFLVVEVKHLAPDDLIILMPLARDQHEVATLRFRDGLMNRVGAIRDLPVRLARLPDSLLR